MRNSYTKIIRLAVVDDSRTFRNTISKLIQHESDLEVSFQADNGKSLLNQLKIETPDIILLDIRMPVMDGVESSILIKNLYPEIKIIALSHCDSESSIIKMNINGAKSFINKNAESKELFKVIRIVSEGGVYLTDSSANIIRNYLRRVSRYDTGHVNLNEQEKILLEGICKGLSSTDLGKVINKSHRTVEKYREELYKKLNVKDKKQLIHKAYHSSLIK